MLALAAFAPPLLAQLQFEELGRRHLPLGRYVSSSAAVADLDGDGDLDLFFGGGRNSFGGTSRLYLNDGTGVFTDASAGRLPTTASADEYWAAAPTDVDGDGDLDLVLANAAGVNTRQDRLWLNDGSGTFTDVTAFQLPPDTDETFALVAGDVDGDGDRDLLMGGRSSQCRLYLNNGAGGFADATATHLPVQIRTTRSLALCDVDGDGDPDLLVANGLGTAEQNQLWINNGTGVFADATALRLPAAIDETPDVVAGDVDGDGDQDLIFADRLQARLYANGGTGTFTDVTATRLPLLSYALSLTLADLDRDGDLDLVASTGYWKQLLVNDGTGVFTDVTATNMPVNVEYTLDVVAGDVDGDGDADLVCHEPTAQDRLFLNDGAATFRDATVSKLPDSRETLAAAAGDVDGDGDPDLVLGMLGSPQLLLNDGTGSFLAATAGWPQWLRSGGRGVAVADLDGDRDLDLVFANGFGSSEQSNLLLNLGAGTFADVTASNLPVFQAEHAAVAAGDVDRDGDVDLVFAIGPWDPRNSGQNRLWLNNGSASFTDATATHLPVLLGNSRGVALHDLDADGDLDLVFANSRQQNRLWRNDGTGHFSDVTATHMPVDADESAGVAVGDVDGDGDPDLVFANGASRNEQSRLYRNDGTGSFTDVTATRLPARRAYSSAVALADVDSDGDLDLAFGNGWNLRRAQNELWLNDGTGTFTDATVGRLPVYQDVTWALVARDLDGDEDVDLLFANGGLEAQNRLCTNLLRQLDAPFLLRVGYGSRLDVHSRLGPPGQVDLALPFLSTGTASIPVPPFGTIGIDPVWMVALPAVVIQSPDRVASVALVVPRNPSLAGLRIWSQAILLQHPWVHLTNLHADEVVR